MLTLKNKHGQSIPTLLWNANRGTNGEFEEVKILPRRQFDVDESKMSSLLEQQILNEVFMKMPSRQIQTPVDGE